MEEIAKQGFPLLVTAEPLMQFDLEEMVALIKRCNPKWVNIGRNSCRSITLPEPTREEVQPLVSELKEFTKVNVKDNALIWTK